MDSIKGCRRKKEKMIRMITLNQKISAIVASNTQKVMKTKKIIFKITINKNSVV